MNIKEFAKIVGVAPSTVSRALNDSYEISIATKKRIREKALELNFEPNPIASNLRQQKNKTIAIVVPDITNHFFAKVIEGVETVAQQKKYHLLIYFTFDSYEKEVETIKHLINGRVGGIVLSLSSQTNEYSHIKEVKERNIPLVFFDRICNEIEAANITTNNKQLSYFATESLIKKKCKEIILLSFSDYSLTAIERKDGYIEALKKNNIKPIIIHCTNDKKHNEETVYTYLQKNKNVDGIIASSESLSFLCYKICKQLKINIGTEVKIIGFTNSPLAELLEPSLTTIHQPAFEIGNEVAKVLFKTIEKPKINYTDTKIVLNSTLMYRLSS